MSLILKQDRPLGDSLAYAQKLTLQAAESVIAALIGLDIPSADLHIKLPNDVYLKGKKLCGILTETVIAGEHVESLILGIGLNLNTLEFPDELVETATSLNLTYGKLFNIREVENAVLAELLERVGE